MLRERKEINWSKTVYEIAKDLSENNENALYVLELLLNSDLPEGVFPLQYLLALDDMDLRGEMIWIAFKMHCQLNLEEFLEKVKLRDQEMIKTVNAQATHVNMSHRVVTEGASQDKSEMIKQKEVKYS